MISNVTTMLLAGGQDAMADVSSATVCVGSAVAVGAMLAHRAAVYFRNKTPKLVPKSVNFHFLRQCNLQCRFCFHTDIGGGYVAPEAQILRTMADLAAAGMTKINFSGGEPFLKPKLLGAMCRYCKETLGVTVSVVSNGTKITEQWLDEFGCYVDIIALSLDSADNETNIFIGRDLTGDHK